MQKSKEINATAASLLGFLLFGPKTGWEMAQQIENSIGYFWNVTKSQIYRELAVLEAHKLICAGKTGIRDKKPYSITEKGRKSFQSWINQEPSQELIRFPLLLNIFFSSEMDQELLSRVIKIQRLKHQSLLNTYREMLMGFKDKNTGPAHTLKFGIAYEEVVLKWIDSLLTLTKNSSLDNQV